MITINYIYKNVAGKWIAESKTFDDVKKALRFMYSTKGRFFNFEWSCDDPEDNDYLNRKFYE